MHKIDGFQQLFLLRVVFVINSYLFSKDGWMLGVIFTLAGFLNKAFSVVLW